MSSSPPAVPATEPESQFSVIVRLLRLTWNYRRDFLLVLFFQLLLVIIGIGGLNLTGVGIDFVRHVVQPDSPVPHWPFGINPPDSWSPMEVVTLLSGLILGLGLLTALFTYLAQAIANRFTQGKIVVDLRGDVFAQLQRLGFRFFDSNASSSVINRITGDVQSLRMFVDEVLLPVITAIVSLVVYTIFMLGVDVRLTLATLASTPLIWIASSRFAKSVKPGYARNRLLVDALVHRLIETIRGIGIIKTFGQEESQLRLFQAANDTVRDQQKSLFWHVSVFSPLLGLISRANMVILLGYGGYLAVQGKVAIGTGLIVFAGILQRFTTQVETLAAVTNTIQQSLRGANRVFEILDAPVDIRSPKKPAPFSRPAGEVRLENISLHYGARQVLTDVSFTVPAGESVGIVGPTGAGKSALISLLPRFYDPSSGRVLLDGTDLCELPVGRLRKNFGFVFQESFLFSTTVAENIAYGHPKATRQEIERAARIAAAHEFIMELPQGYETTLGEAGVGLSGGQRQRLAIARALVHDPAILVFDDPTAAVDASTEQEIADALEAAMAGRTTFIVAHRPAILQRVNRIVVMNHGRVEQSGTREELIGKGYFGAIESVWGGTP